MGFLKGGRSSAGGLLSDIVEKQFNLRVSNINDEGTVFPCHWLRKVDTLPPGLFGGLPRNKQERRFSLLGGPSKEMQEHEQACLVTNLLD